MLGRPRPSSSLHTPSSSFILPVCWCNEMDLNTIHFRITSSGLTAGLWQSKNLHGRESWRDQSQLDGPAKSPEKGVNSTERVKDRTPELPVSRSPTARVASAGISARLFRWTEHIQSTVLALVLLCRSASDTKVRWLAHTTDMAFPTSWV